MSALGASQPYLRIGSGGALVRAIQEHLEEGGFWRDGIEGVFDRTTEEAVRVFQRSRKLDPDGIIGPDTWQALADDGLDLASLPETEPSQGRPPRPFLRIGSVGPHVGAIQEYLGVKPTTVFDVGTEEGVVAFQENAGLYADGIVGPATWSALLRSGLSTESLPDFDTVAVAKDFVSTEDLRQVVSEEHEPITWEQLSRLAQDVFAWAAAAEHPHPKVGTRGLLIGLLKVSHWSAARQADELLEFAQVREEELFDALQQVRPEVQINPTVRDPNPLTTLPPLTSNGNRVLNVAGELRDDPAAPIDPEHLFGAILQLRESKALEALERVLEGRVDMEAIRASYIDYLRDPEIEYSDFLQLRFAAPPPAIATAALPEARATSDRWTTVDELGYDVYADALADFIQNPDTPTPLAISIKGEWGSGKTSLMRMLRKRIDPLSPDGEDPVPRGATGSQTGRTTNEAVLEQLQEPPEDRNLLSDPRLGHSVRTAAAEQAENQRRTDLPTIWFNAWIYQSSRQLWAGLAVAIINGVASRMSFVQRERFWLTLQIRRADGAALRRRLYRELAQRVLPKVAMLFVVSLAGLALWALHSVLAFPAALTAAAGASFLAPLVATPLYGVYERRKFLKEGLSAAFSDLVREPDYATEAGFLHLFHRDMKLILEAAGVSKRKPLVIFVDDLDRCTYGTVAEVVEGLNLFLAGEFPHCIFVIGMEPTLVAAQLGVAYKDLFATLSGDDSAAARIRYGWKFLEKMVQLPIALPAPRASRLERYVGSLTSYGADGESAAIEAFEPADETEIKEQEQALVNELDRRGGNIADVAAAARVVDASIGEVRVNRATSSTPSVRPSVVAAARRVVSSRANEDDPIVRQMYRDYAGQLSGNPREFKRFLNLFRFYANLQVTRELSPFPAPSLEQVGKITMIAVRWPDLVREFTTTSGGATAVATLELLAGKHRTANAWSTAVKKKGLSDATCDALLRADIYTFLRQRPSIADYAEEFL